MYASPRKNGRTKLNVRINGDWIDHSAAYFYSKDTVLVI